MELNRVDLNKIAVFCQVIESGGYQRASEALGVTPSALSQTITTLEFALGFPLFDRAGRRLIPTARGLKLHREFRTHQSSFLHALRDLGGQQNTVSGLLRVGAYLEFAKARLTPVLKDFAREFAEAQVKMTFDTPTRLHQLLMQGQLDLCFSIYPSNETKMIESESVCQEELVLIAPRHLISDAPSFEEVMTLPMIEYYLNHQPIRRWLALHYQKRPKKVPVRIFAATAEMVFSLVREGAGIGVVPAYLVSGTEVHKTIKIIRPTAKRLTDYIWLLEKVSTERSLVHSTFRERLMNRFR